MIWLKILVPFAYIITLNLPLIAEFVVTDQNVKVLLNIFHLAVIMSSHLKISSCVGITCVKYVNGLSFLFLICLIFIPQRYKNFPNGLLLNPVVSYSAWLKGKITLTQCTTVTFGYIFGSCVGYACYLILAALTDESVIESFSNTDLCGIPIVETNDAKLFAEEFFYAFLMVSVYHFTNDYRLEFAQPILNDFFSVLTVMPIIYSGTNGPRLSTQRTIWNAREEQIWIYLAAPYAGSFFATKMLRGIFIF